MNNNKYTQIYLKLNNILDKNIVDDWESKIKVLNFECAPEFNKNELMSLQNDSAYKFRVYYRDSGYDFRIYRSSENWLSIRFYRFADALTVLSDYEECDELIFDTAIYLNIALFFCENLIIQYIEVLENEELDFSHLPDPIKNTIAVYTGSTYYLRSPYQYLIIILKNIIDNNGLISNNFTDINGAAKYFASKFTENVDNVPLRFIFDNQEFELIIYSTNLVLKPIGKLKLHMVDDKEHIDVAYYAKIMIFICKDLGIRDLETYFN